MNAPDRLIQNPEQLSQNRIKLEKNKLILAEGPDALYFFVWACREYRTTDDVQVLSFGGVNELHDYLSQLTKVEGYYRVDTIVIARDAENDATSAVASIKDSMIRAGMPTPQNPFEYTRCGIPKTAFCIFPGPDQSKGTLEQLCLSTVERDPIMICVDDFLKCVQSKGEGVPRPHKNRLHCFLSGKDKYVGSTIGQASYKKAWDPRHQALLPFKTIIEQM